jgi:pectin methylesterase-like acyl-CoA thioesterase
MLILARSSGLPAVVAAAVLALAAASAHAVTTIRVPDDHATISEAILASEWGDTILVGPGVYKESLVLSDTKGDGIILKSVEGPETTTIAYGDAAGNVNEAVITFQRCSGHTRSRRIDEDILPARGKRIGINAGKSAPVMQQQAC